jgi:hypothetical protein
VSEPDHPSAVYPLLDFGIRWSFYVPASDVRDGELDLIAKQHDGRVPWAYTFGSVNPASRSEYFVDMTDPDLEGYESATTVHLWNMNADAGEKRRRTWSQNLGWWRHWLVHTITHETLHHAIGRFMAELGEHGPSYPDKDKNENWVIDRMMEWWCSTCECWVKGSEPNHPIRPLQLHQGGRGLA